MQNLTELMSVGALKGASVPTGKATGFRATWNAAQKKSERITQKDAPKIAAVSPGRIPKRYRKSTRQVTPKKDTTVTVPVMPPSLPTNQAPHLAEDPPKSPVRTKSVAEKAPLPKGQERPPSRPMTDIRGSWTVSFPTRGQPSGKAGSVPSTSPKPVGTIQRPTSHKPKGPVMPSIAPPTTKRTDLKPAQPPATILETTKGQAVSATKTGVPTARRLTTRRLPLKPVKSSTAPSVPTPVTASPSNPPSVSPHGRGQFRESGIGAIASMGAPKPTPVQSTASPRHWRIQAVSLKKGHTQVETRWKVTPPFKTRPWTMVISQKGPEVKADVTVPHQDLGWAAPVLMTMPAHAVHLPEGVSHFELSLWAGGSQDGATGGFSSGSFGGDRQGGSSGGDRLPWAARAAPEFQSEDGGVDFRA